MQRKILGILIGLLVLGTAPPASAQFTWTETSSADFNDGVFENTEVISDDLRLADVPPENWTQATSSARWSARRDFTSVVYDGKMWVLGGDNGAYKNDVWYSTDGVTWIQATSAAAWSARTTHTSLVFDGKMWVIGGLDGDHKNDVWYSSDGTNWTQATSAAAWLGRRQHTSVVFGGKMWVIGGYHDPTGPKNDVWYSSDGVNWT